MFTRNTILSAIVFTFGTFGAACADMGDDDQVGFQLGAAELCPAVYEPVCGKDGLTYSNECEAGGRKNVAYAGECNALCATVLCLEGTQCFQDRNGAGCYEIQTGGCAVVRCGSGKCVDLGNGGAICTGN